MRDWNRDKQGREMGMRMRWGMLLLLLTPLVAAGGDETGPWLVDSQNQARIWNPAPGAEETVRWIGSAGQADGSGMAIWYVNGEEREQAAGQWRDGRMEGHGVWKHASGARYEGGWKNGRRHGVGIYTWPDGIRFFGCYEQGARREGICLDASGNPVNGPITAETRKWILQAESAALEARRAATHARRTVPVS